MATYDERLTAALQEILPDGFDVHVDSYIVTAGYGTARLVGYPPSGVDRRAAVTADDAVVWLARALASLRRDVHHYTPEAKKAAAQLFSALGVSA